MIRVARSAAANASGPWTPCMHPESLESAVHRLLERWRGGDARAADELVRMLYQDLRAIAASRLRSSPGHSIAPTELVHEAFVKLANAPIRSWEDRCHFINAAGGAMRSILVDRARAKHTAKRSASTPHAALDGPLALQADADAVLEINDAIAALERIDERSARIVVLRFFAGLTEPEIAQVLGVHERTIRRDWLFARAWLRRHIDRGSPSEQRPHP